MNKLSYGKIITVMSSGYNVYIYHNYESIS